MNRAILRRRLFPWSGETPMALLRRSCPHCKALFQVEAGQQPLACGQCGGPLNDADTEPLWFYVSNKQKAGPVPLPHLSQLAATGQLQPSDMVLQHGAS